MKRYVLGLVVLTMLLATACGAPVISPQTPPEIVYGEDVCDHCGMIINEERFAAGLLIQSGTGQLEHRIFDDIGDMFAFAQEFTAQASNAQTGDDAPQIVTYFVHDFQSGEWLNAHEAYFIVAQASLTPMGSGMVAFGSREEAETQAQAWQTPVLDFEMAQHEMGMKSSHTQH